MTPLPFPEIYVPIQATDATWYTTSVGEVETHHAVILTRNDLWDAVGLDGVSGRWSDYDGYSDTTWVQWPEPDLDFDFDYEALGGRELALDHEGNLWVATADSAIYMMPAPTMHTVVPGPDYWWEEHPIERDCLFELYGSGSHSISVGAYDGAVWAALLDQGSDVPHNIGVFRALYDEADEDGNGEEWDWAYQGAAVRNWQGRTSGNEVKCRDFLDASRHAVNLEKVGVNHLALPMDGTGYAFTSDPAGTVNAGLPGTNPALASWGNPESIRALDKNVAVVAFRSYTAGGYTVPGTLAFTIDGGANWTKVPFEDPGGTCTDDYGFYDRFLKLSLIGVGTKSFVADNGGTIGVLDPMVDDWRIDVLLSSSHVATAGGSPGSDTCNLARVTIDPSGADWEWLPIPHQTGRDTTTVCRVGGANMSGVVASPWSNEAFIWGKYTRVNSAEPYSEWGGVCAVNLDTYGIQRVVTPVTPEGKHRLDIGTVEPHPRIAGTLLMSTLITTGSTSECRKRYINLATDGILGNEEDACPVAALPLLATHGFPLWSVSQVPGAPSGLAGSSVAWADLPVAWEEAPDFYYGSSGGGIWQAILWW